MPGMCVRKVLQGHNPAHTQRWNEATAQVLTVLSVTNTELCPKGTDHHEACCVACISTEDTGERLLSMLVGIAN